MSLTKILLIERASDLNNLKEVNRLYDEMFEVFKFLIEEYMMDKRNYGQRDPQEKSQDILDKCFQFEVNEDLIYFLIVDRSPSEPTKAGSFGIHGSKSILALYDNELSSKFKMLVTEMVRLTNGNPNPDQRFMESAHKMVSSRFAKLFSLIDEGSTSVHIKHELVHALDRKTDPDRYHKGVKEMFKRIDATETGEGKHTLYMESPHEMKAYVVTAVENAIKTFDGRLLSLMDGEDDHLYRKIFMDEVKRYTSRMKDEKKRRKFLVRASLVYLNLSEPDKFDRLADKALKIAQKKGIIPNQDQ